MNFESQTDEQLAEQFKNLVEYKFRPPYLDEVNRKAIDEIILATWQEMQSRKEGGE